MEHPHKVCCVLCRRSEETKITGALSTKDQVTAHQNCLLFSSGIYCQNSPQFDDLFGFSAKDVQNEVKRGGKLKCYKCKRKGATAGCEVKCCKRSYHYPCAVQADAHAFEDTDNEKYGLYCVKHYEEKQKTDGFVNGCAPSFPKCRTSKNPSEAGPSKKGICLESFSDRIMLSCNKHAPPSHKRSADGDSPAAGPSAYSSDSSSSSCAVPLSSKRRLSCNDEQGGTHFKRKCNGWKRRLSVDSSGSDEKELNSEMAIFAPLESDLEESANSESQLIGEDTAGPTASTSGHQLEVERKEGNKDKDETIIDSDAESESLLLPVEICMDSQSLSASGIEVFTQTEHPSVILVKEEAEKQEDEGSSFVHSLDPQAAGPSVPEQRSAEPPPPPDHADPPPPPDHAEPPPPPDHAEPRSVTGSPPCTSSAISPAPPEILGVSHLSSPPSPSAPSMDSTRFWKSCNAAECTQSIFTDFINEMNDISRRIQSDQASQEDYDRALTVMKASGKLAEIVDKQQKDLQRKQMELQKAAAVMKEVVSALKR